VAERGVLCFMGFNGELKSVMEFEAKWWRG